MKTLVRLGILMLLAALIQHDLPAHAVFDLERPGARAAGLAGAFTGLADDADAVLYNPAGLAQTLAPLVSLNFARLLTGLDEGLIADQRIAYLHPLEKAGVIAGTWYQRQLSGLYAENTLAVHYALALDSEGRYQAGAGLKWLALAYLEDGLQAADPVYFERTRASGLGLDLGGLARITPEIAVGLSLANVNQPDLAVSAAGRATVPLRLRLGGVYQRETWLATADLAAQADTFRVAAGGEYWWLGKLLSARAGLAAHEGGLAELAAGLSLRLEWPGWGGQLDYAFVTPLGGFAAAGPTHQVNLAILFGVPASASARAASLAAAGRKARTEGRLQEALGLLEQAKELQPQDPALAEAVDELKKEIQRVSEINLHMQQGRKHSAAGHNQNAVLEFRKVLKLAPDHTEARASLEAAEERIKKMTLAQQQQLQAAEREAERQAELQKQREALQEVQKATAAYEAAEQDPRFEDLESDLLRVRNLLEEARESWRRREFEHSQAVAQTAQAEVGRLPARARKLREAEENARRIAEVVPTPVISPPAVSSVDQPRLQKKARGAYGLAVKHMMEIEDAKGPSYFPERCRGMKAQLAAIRKLLKSQDYETAIAQSEKLFPELQKLKQEALDKEKARKAMPTTW